MEVFKQACPHYINYGMTYKEFWYGDVEAHRMYREAHKQKLEEENFKLWLNGKYIYDVLCMTAPMLRAFTENSRPREYHNNPLPIFKEQAEAIEEREAKERYERIKRNVEAFANAYAIRNNTEGKEGAKDGG